jgi:murein tripeptide amidase MpaA
MLRFPTLLLFAALCTPVAQVAADPAPPLEFIDTSFENASPLWYDFAEDGTVRVHLNYDHERSSPNRAAGHFHFRLQAAKGTKLKLEFLNLENVWNGRLGSVAKELKQVVVSTNGRDWTAVPTESPEPGRATVSLTMPADALYVARAEPYRLSDLQRFLGEIQKDPRVRLEMIGKTVQGRELEMVRVGSDNAPHRVFLRARAHPWEPAGNWVIEGLVRRLLSEEGKGFLERYSVCILPMTNKDGVERGGTRFNLMGKDLNRNWDKPADPQLAPENAALERWLAAEIEAGRRPDLALDFHNDGSGRLHLARPEGAEGEKHVQRMHFFEQCLRRHTWFTEGTTQPSFRNPGSLGEGFFTRFGIDGAILEFHCNFIAGLNQPALGRHWVTFGHGLVEAFDTYFRGVEKP